MLTLNCIIQNVSFIKFLNNKAFMHRGITKEHSVEVISPDDRKTSIVVVLNLMSCTVVVLTCTVVLDFKLSPCFVCRMFSFGLFPGVCSLNANVSEHSVCSIFIGESVRSVTAVEKFVVREKFRTIT
jgi:hypothetical protein